MSVPPRRGGPDLKTETAETGFTATVSDIIAAHDPHYQHGEAPWHENPESSAGRTAAGLAVTASGTDGRRASRGPAMSERLIEHAVRHFDVWRTPEGRMVGVQGDQPGRILADGKPSPLMHAVLDTYFAQHSRWPDTKAAAACSSFLEVRASRAETRPAPMRCTWDGTHLLVDLGDPAWQVLDFSADGWRLLREAPAGVAFRRSPVTAALPVPADREDLNALWRLAPVEAADRPLVVALLLHAWLTGVAQPVVYVTGPQDSGKTETARFLLSLIDPVTTERGGSLPSREEEWKARLSPYLLPAPGEDARDLLAAAGRGAFVAAVVVSPVTRPSPERLRKRTPSRRLRRGGVMLSAARCWAVCCPGSAARYRMSDRASRMIAPGGAAHGDRRADRRWTPWPVDLRPSPRPSSLGRSRRTAATSLRCPRR